jgi:hypothetical protein
MDEVIKIRRVTERQDSGLPQIVVHADDSCMGTE